VGTDEVRHSAFEVQVQPVGSDNLVDYPEFWQVEQGFDTLKIHEQGSSFWMIGVSSILRGILRMSIIAISYLFSILYVGLKLGKEP
jgi:hypothetical protein